MQCSGGKTAQISYKTLYFKNYYYLTDLGLNMLGVRGLGGAAFVVDALTDSVHDGWCAAFEIDAL